MQHTTFIPPDILHLDKYREQTKKYKGGIKNGKGKNF
jgi:hypothetical protein